MSAQERYERYRQMIGEAMAQQPVAAEQLIGFAIAVNEPPTSNKRLATGALLAGGPGVVAVQAVNYKACLVAATNQRMLFLFLSGTNSYKVETLQAIPYPSVQIVQVKRKVFGLEKIAILETPIGKLWLTYVPRMIVGKLDAVLNVIRQQQTNIQATSAAPSATEQK